MKKSSTTDTPLPNEAEVISAVAHALRSTKLNAWLFTHVFPMYREDRASWLKRIHGEWEDEESLRIPPEVSEEKRRKYIKTKPSATAWRSTRDIFLREDWPARLTEAVEDCARRFYLCSTNDRTVPNWFWEVAESVLAGWCQIPDARLSTINDGGKMPWCVAGSEQDAPAVVRKGEHTGGERVADPQAWGKWFVASQVEGLTIQGIVKAIEKNKERRAGYHTVYRAVRKVCRILRVEPRPKRRIHHT